MTTAKISAKLPKDGHGLTPSIADEYYEARAQGEPTPDLIAVARIVSSGHGEDDGKRVATWKFDQFEIVGKSDERHDTVCAILDDERERRIGYRQLPMDYDERDDDEKRRHLLALVDEWATEEGLSAGDVADRWRSQWGISGDEPSPDGAFPHPDINQAAPHHIQEFCLMVGVLADDNVASTAEDDEAAAQS